MIPANGETSARAALLDAASPANGTLLFSQGPLERLLDWLHLGGEDTSFLLRRIVVALSLTWLPLLVLALIDGHASGGATVPFLFDADVNARLLVALPALLVAGHAVGQRFRSAMRRIHERHLLAPPQLAAFHASLARVRAWADRGWIDALLLVLVALAALTGRAKHPSALALETWYAQYAAGGVFLVRPAGYWLAWVSLPLVQFLMLRWCARLLYWWFLAWRLSRSPLQLQPLNPDQAGGLGFLDHLTTSFMPWLFALGTMAAGWIANQILYRDATLAGFRIELLVLAGASVLLAAGPMLLFAQAMVRARRRATSNYATLATHYAERFVERWFKQRHAPPDDLLGTGDFGSLADLGNSFQTVKGMRAIPLGRGTILLLVGTVLAPSAPLLLTLFSAEELLMRVLGMLF